MSNKLLLAALTFITAATLTVPFIGRAENIRFSVRENPTGLESNPVEEAPTRSTEDEPQVLSLEVTPSGFEPRETIARRGKFLILLQNRTGRRDLKFWLAREAEGRIAESTVQTRDWKVHMYLDSGTYIVGETNHPEWKSIIRVTN
jgi:hypothetical protein